MDLGNHRTGFFALKALVSGVGATISLQHQGGAHTERPSKGSVATVSSTTQFLDRDVRPHKPPEVQGEDTHQQEDKLTKC